MKPFDKETVLQQYLTPSVQLIKDISRIDGDILILGAGGKMGPAMAKLAKEAINKAGIPKKSDCRITVLRR